MIQPYFYVNISPWMSVQALLTFASFCGVVTSLLLGSVRAAVSINYACSARLLLGFLLGYNAQSSSIFCRADNPE